MNDDQLLASFAGGALPPEGFRHADHVRVAFLYLLHEPPARAAERFAVDLQRFAAAIGKPHIYDAQVTSAYLTLIAERLALCGTRSWTEFSAANRDLLERGRELIASPR